MSPSKAHRRCGEMARWLPFDSASFGLAVMPITFGVVEFRERLNSKTQATRCDASACVRPRRPTCKLGNWPVARRSPGREHAAWLPCRCDAGVIQPTYSRDEIASENGFSAEQLRTSPSVHYSGMAAASEIFFENRSRRRQKIPLDPHPPHEQTIRRPLRGPVAYLHDLD